MQRLNRLMALTFIFIFPMAFLAFAQPDMREGMWEITTQIEMPGMPMQMPAVTYTQCITKDDLIPQDPQPDQECETIDYKIDGNTVTYKIECSSQGGQIKGQGTATYHDDTMSGSMQMTISEQAHMEMSYEYSGRWIGECQ